MKPVRHLPVLSICNFEDYNCCRHCGNSFYIRRFNRHLQDNLFLDEPHAHDFFILLFITNGSGVHNIDCTRFEVRPPVIFMISPGQVHNWQLSDDVDGFIIFFTGDYLFSDSNASHLNYFHLFNSRINNPVIQIAGKDLKPIIGIFENIDSEYLQQSRMFNEVIRLNLGLLLILLDRNYSEQNQVSFFPNHQENLIKNFQTVVENFYAEHLPLTTYADKLNISLKQLNSMCRKYLNKTPGDVIQERLIIESKRLLIHTDYSVTSISYLLNFTDSSYFIRFFRKVTGTTPEQFRIKVKNDFISAEKEFCTDH